MPYTEMGKTWRTLPLISGHARRDKSFRFTSLAHLLDAEFLRDCYNSLNRNKAVGIDNMSWEEYGLNLENNLVNLVSRLKRGTYVPIPAKRVYIPKNQKEKRPLGISALENKIVERAVTWILESIYEQDFLNSSYGFRPGRNCHQALKQVHDLIRFQPINHIVEADIRSFFDNVSHARLLEFLQQRVGDPNMLRLIEKFLEAGYVDAGLLVTSDSGTPQGSILSPILSNIFLHYVLDTWFECTVKSHVQGFCELVRYADDFICVVRFADDARRIERALHNRFNKYGLEIHPVKSRNITFGRYERMNAHTQKRRANTFDFLGIPHYCDVSRKGNFKIGRKTSRKKFAVKCRDMNDWLRKVRNQVKTKAWWKTLSAKLRGHFQYYGMSENYASIARFYTTTLRLVRKWLNRRSQKRKMNWSRFIDYLSHYPLPTPRIVHNFYVSPVW
ncbi:MAG: group II intron reverse transcriptase/maturase [bacterium]|nr:group II intron reverse transcriptase/maturase [bacterium]